MYLKSKYGYRIVKDMTGRQLLVPLLANNRQPEYEHYYRLPRDLFRRFAKLQRSEAAVLDFANRHGELGLKQRSLPEPPAAEDLDSGEPQSPGFTTVQYLAAEYVEQWHECAQELRDAVSICEALSAVNDRRLKQLLVHRHNRYWCMRDLRLEYADADASFRRLYSDEKCGKDMRLAAKDYVYYLLWRNLQEGSASFTVERDETYNLQIMDAGNGLLNGMWLQFARWYCQESEHVTHEGRVCERAGCRTTFTAKSLKAKWCSDACRQAAYRQRHRTKQTMT